MNLLPKELIASQYKDAFKAYLTSRVAAHAHNQRIVDEFVLTIKPVTVTKLLLQSGQTVVCLGRSDGYWNVVQDRSVEQWEYFNLVGQSAPIKVSPDDDCEPFYNWYFSAHGISTEIRLLAGTDEAEVCKEFINKMFALPHEPARPQELNWQETDAIERQVRNELG